MAGIYIVMKHWPHETSFTFAVRKKGLRSIALKPKLYRLRYWILGALTGGRRAYSSQFIHIKIYLKTHYLNVMFQRDVLFPLFSFICFSFHGTGQYLIFATCFPVQTNAYQPFVYLLWSAQKDFLKTNKQKSNFGPTSGCLWSTRSEVIFNIKAVSDLGFRIS